MCSSDLPIQRGGGTVQRCGVTGASLVPDGGGEDIDWDKEAIVNRYYHQIKAIPLPDLVREFAMTAPRPVQHAVRSTIVQLLGNLPPEAASITATRHSIASLMMSMQMTGYMFRNAEYCRSLASSLAESELLDSSGAAALPPVKGTISVKLGEGTLAEVNAASCERATIRFHTTHRATHVCVHGHTSRHAPRRHHELTCSQMWLSFGTKCKVSECSWRYAPTLAPHRYLLGGGVGGRWCCTCARVTTA